MLSLRFLLCILNYCWFFFYNIVNVFFFFVVIEKNFEIWEEMKKGIEYGQRFVLRVKFDYQFENGCLRDLIIYWCKFEEYV